MKKIVECVPNISEGKNQEIIKQVVDAARIDGVKILDVDAGAATNRTVITFVGEPELVCEAAFRLIAKASELIDMRNHKGEHPRIGATDVVPFIPVQNVSMQECVELAQKLAKRVAQELEIPTYLYEDAATKPERKSLASIREGEYEALAKKLVDKNWAPDFGSAKFNAKSGVTIIGARPFLIAYNINLNTKSKKLANSIAFKLRESGYKKKDAQGNIIKDEQGQAVIVKGAFTHCRAVGWYIEEYESAQISINLTNFLQTPLHAVFDQACQFAAEAGLRVTGSEIVGLVPKQAILDAGRFFLSKQGSTRAVNEYDLIQNAIRSLGLNEFSTFKPEEKIIEETLRTKAKLTNLSLTKFNDLLASSAPAPGGGSVAALAGSLSAALVSMVAALSFEKTKEADKKPNFEKLGLEAQKIKDNLMQAVEDDTLAFEQVMAAFKIKATSPESEKLKQNALISAYKYACQIPFNVAKECLNVLNLAKESLETGLSSAFSDSAVACQLTQSAFLGASYNVLINLKELIKLLPDNEKNYVTEMKIAVEKIKSEIADKIKLVDTRIESELLNP